MRLHVEHLASKHVADGLSPEEARFAAQRRFGGIDQFKEECRDGRGWRLLDNFTRDSKYAFRGLWREKAFTTTVLATLGLCMASNIVIFTIVHSILIAPLPFKDPSRLVVPDDSYVKQGLEHVGASVRNYLEWKGSVPAFAEVGAFNVGTAAIGDPGSPEVVKTVSVTPSFFRVLGVQAEIGRLFLEEEGSYGGNNHWNAVVLSDNYWRQHFGADREIIGKTIHVGGGERIIIGVLPPGFRYLSTEAPLWITLVWTAKQLADPTRHWMTTNVIARLAPGTSIEQAQAQIDALNARLAKDDPEAELVKAGGFRTTVRELHAAHVERARPALLLLQGGGLLLLIVGIVNVMNLLVVRASARGNEMSVRRALGASRWNIIAQFLTETAILAGLGAVLGFGFAAAALQLVDRLGVDQLPLGESVHLTLPVLTVSVCASISLALTLVIPLAAFTSRTSLVSILASESRGVGATRAVYRLRHSLIVAQVALAFVLLTGAGLLGVSFNRILAVDPGFHPDKVLTAWIGLPWADYKDTSKRASFASRWLEKARSMPGVDLVGFGDSTPVVGGRSSVSMQVEGYEPAPGDALQPSYLTFVSGDYFAALGIPLVEGRYLHDADFLGSKKLCVVDEDFARRHWPGRSPLGFRVSIYGGKIDDDSLRIVGVVGNTKQDGLTDKAARGVLYATMSAKSPPFRILTIVRSSIPPGDLVPELRTALLGIDPLLPLDDIDTLGARIERSLLFQRSLMYSAGLFSGIALLLAAVGMYGVMSYAVIQRRREIGVRMALGADRSQVMLQFLRLSGRLLLFGLIPGAMAAYIVGRLMESLLFDVSPSSVDIYVGTSVTLAAVLLLASVLPARRAAEASVMDSLREG